MSPALLSAHPARVPLAVPAEGLPPFEVRDRWRTWYTPGWHEDGSRPYRTLAEARIIQERRRAWHEQWRARFGQEYQWIRIFDRAGRIVAEILP